MTAAQRALLAFAVAVAIATADAALDAAPIGAAIHLDHFGYRPTSTKVAIFSANPGATVEVRTAPGDQLVTTVSGAQITSRGLDADSGDTVWWVDLSALTSPGSYRLYSPALGVQSYDFRVANDVYLDALRAATKSFYYQRCGVAKPATWAGAWADAAACHTADVATTAAAGHTDHGSRDLTGGWHDAGDYNKYAWSATALAVRYLLQAFEHYPDAFGDDLGIPESGNGVADVLDEVRVELDWLLRMQLPDGSVLAQMHVPGFAADAPPSADTNLRYYHDPNRESAGVFAGTLARAARILAPYDMPYATTLVNAALAAWGWLAAQPGDDVWEAWAAAELLRQNPAAPQAATWRVAVDGHHANQWNEVFLNVVAFDTLAALTYVEAPGATPAVVANMRQSISNQVDYIVSEDDHYRNGMPDWSFYWGSNAIRAGYGQFLLDAARLGQTGAISAGEARRRAEDFLRFFHGQNALSMLYLTQMSAFGGEHSSWQLYHAWFGDSTNPYSSANHVGKPTAISEPAYPYFAGVDNLGVNDNKVSALGPAPGFVPGGPNANYGGIAVPPLGAVRSKAYRDWCDQTANWMAQTWEITENSIGYQGTYVALVAAFTERALFADGFESGTTAAWIAVP